MSGDGNASFSIVRLLTSSIRLRPVDGFQPMRQPSADTRVRQRAVYRRAAESGEIDRPATSYSIDRGRVRLPLESPWGPAVR